MDWGKSGRKDYFRATLADVRNLSDVGDVDIIPSECSLTWGLESDTLYSGDISLVGSLPDQSSRLIRIWHRYECDGKSDEYPIATMFVDANSRNVLRKAERNKLSCYSTLLRFSEDKLDVDLFRSKGESMTDTLRLISDTRGAVLVIDPGVKDKAFSEDYYFELGDPLNEVINKLVGWMDARVKANAYGYLHIVPNVDAKKGTPEFDFTASNSVYIPGADVDDGRDKVCNRSVAYYSTKNGTGRYVADLPNSNPYSFASLGRYVPIITKLTDREYSEQELKSKAEEILNENSCAIKYVTISHVLIPHLTVGSLVTYSNDTDFLSPFSARCIIEEMNLNSLTPGGMCTSKLKVVV